MKKKMKVKMVWGDICNIEDRVNNYLKEMDIDPENVSLYFYCDGEIHICIISYYGYDF